MKNNDPWSAVDKLCKQVQKPPAGWLSMAQLASRWNCALQRARTEAKMLLEDGALERGYFRVTNGNRALFYRPTKAFYKRVKATKHK